MKRIYIFGGGEISQEETYDLDKIVVKSANKDNPRVLFIPTASYDSNEYQLSFKNTYLSLGCEVDFLYLHSQKTNHYQIADKFNNCDIIYIGGGNTSHLKEVWNKYHIDEYLQEAYNKEVIICGLSAGGIILCNYGYSDSINKNDFNCGFIEGLHMLDYDHNPHASEDDRKDFLYDYQRFLKNKGKRRAISMDNCTLAYFENGILKNSYAINSNKVKIVYKDNDKIRTEELQSIIVQGENNENIERKNK